MAAFHRRDAARVADAVERHLRYRPNVEEGAKKLIDPGDEESPPTWQLRVADHRVWYRVAPAARHVLVREVFFKGRDTTARARERKRR